MTEKDVFWHRVLKNHGCFQRGGKPPVEKKRDVDQTKEGG
jgi:hypothetical protein